MCETDQLQTVLWPLSLSLTSFSTVFILLLYTAIKRQGFEVLIHPMLFNFFLSVHFLFLLFGIPSNLHLQPNFFWFKIQLRICWLWNVSSVSRLDASLAPTAYFCLSEYSVILKLFACAFLAYQTGNLMRQETIDVPTIRLECHSFSTSLSNYF